MLISFLVSSFLSLLTICFSWLPDAGVLPAGTILATGIENVHVLEYSFPFLGIMFAGFLVVVGWKITLFFLRVFKIVHWV